MSAPKAQPIDPVTLTGELVRIPSVTPDEGAAIGHVAEALAQAGFACHRADRGGVANLVALAGDPAAGPVFGFNGHVDVVPPGEAGLWRHPPFSGEIAEGKLWGRGAADMKSGVAAFAAAAARFRAEGRLEKGAIVITVTGDEEGDADYGTRAILDWMWAKGLRMDHCLVGEPTCPQVMGEMMKIGRRGSVTVDFVARGVQGHSAYPQRAKNPVHALVALLARLTGTPLDAGTAHFEPSTLVVTTFDVGNPAANVIPAEARARVNIRFNDLHTGAGLIERLKAMAAEVEAGTGVQIEVAGRISGEAFLTEPGPFTELVASAVESETGRRPEASTSGGTSDARFIKDMCPVVEFGIVGSTMHKTDEHVAVEDIRSLERVYHRILESYFAAPPEG